MELKICVCAKYVPESTETNKINPVTNRLVREGMPKELDQGAMMGVEEGLRLVEACGGTVTVFTMGPPEAEEGLRRAIAIGAHDAVLISDPLLAGSDALATAKVLSAALSQVPFDLVLCGSESTDSYTGLMPGMLAELLGLPQLTFAKSIEVRESTVLVRRDTESGSQLLAVELPALVAVTSSINRPRYPTLRGTLAAKRRRINRLRLADLGIPPRLVGPTGAKERVLSIEAVSQRRDGMIVADDGQGGILIADYLEGLRVL